MTVLEPPMPPVQTKKPTISLEMAERAAKEAGFSIVDAAKLRAAGVLGEFITEIGAINLGRSRLAFNVAHADKAMVFLEDKIERAGDSESLIGIAKVIADLIGKSNNAAELLIKSAQQAAETAKTEASTVLPGFAPRTSAGVPTQINVVVNANEATEVSAKRADVEV